MPFCVGGGVNSIDDFSLLLNNGADKVSINTAAFLNPKLIKESADIYEKAGRLELLESEKKEIDIISCFLPKQMSNIEISEAVEKIIKETNASSIKDMGNLMNILKKDYAGRCDFSLVAKIAREKLG